MKNEAYFSFLLCTRVQQDDKAVDVYFNGLPIGNVRDGVFNKHQLTVGDKQMSLTFPNLAKPNPFESVEDLKKFLHGVVDLIEIELPPDSPNEN